MRVGVVVVNEQAREGEQGGVRCLSLCTLFISLLFRFCLSSFSVSLCLSLSFFLSFSPSLCLSFISLLFLLSLSFSLCPCVSLFERTKGTVEMLFLPLFFSTTTTHHTHFSSVSVGSLFLTRCTVFCQFIVFFSKRRTFLQTKNKYTDSYPIFTIYFLRGARLLFVIH